MQMLDILVTDIVVFQKKKEGRFPKVIERHRFQASQTHTLGIYIHWDLDSKYLGITWKMGNCTFAIVLGVISLFS